MNNEDKEFYTIIIAALFHDIGKFLQRSQTKKPHEFDSLDYRYTHSKWTYWFFKKKYSRIPEKIDIEFLSSLAASHHNPKNHNQKIIQLADCYSAGSDRTEGEGEGKPEKTSWRSAPSECIYDRININNLNAKDKHYYHLLNIFYNENTIPLPLDEKWERQASREYKRLFNAFNSKLRKIKENNIDRLIQIYMNLLEIYTWCIPSDTQHRTDISLYDHLATTAAFASALYKYHGKNKIDVTKIINYKWKEYLEVYKDKKPLLLVMGTIGGIQRFIFSYSAGGAKGLSKTLRARSFYISALTDIFAIYLLDRLKYPLINKIIHTANKFVLVLDNNEGTNSIIKEGANKINEWLLKEYNSELNFTYAELEVSPNDIDINNFKETYSSLESKLKMKKLTKQNTAFASDNKWDENKFIRKGFSSESIQVCSFCNNEPSKEDTANEEKKCKKCDSFAKLGSILSKAQLYAIFRKPNIKFAGDKVFKVLDNDYAFALFQDDKKAEENLNKADFIWCIKDPKKIIKDYRINKNIKSLEKIKLYPTRLIMNYVPIDDEGDILTFEQIADKSDGDKMLAVLKADIDNLGYILHQGIDKLSVSRLATFSRMTDYFFRAYLYSLLSGYKKRNEDEKQSGNSNEQKNRQNENDETKKYADIYTVFAGGDDILLVGPWDKTIEFACKLKDEFTRFTGHNPDITLSAGISLLKPKSNITQAVEYADKMLSLSKDYSIIHKEDNLEKNRITLFSTTVKWEEMTELMDFANFLLEKLKHNSKKNNGQESRMSRGFVFRLLKYHEMYLNYINGYFRDLLYRPRLLYDIKRNIEIREGKEVKNTEEVDRIRKLLNQDEITGDMLILKNMKIPALWVLYKTRLKEKERRTNYAKFNS